MSFSLRGLLRKSPLLDAESKRRIGAWKSLKNAALDVPLAQTHWLVVDTETSGLDVKKDRLISIGAVIIEGCTLRMGRSFHVVIRQEAVSATQNILVHGIGDHAQSSGAAHAHALAEFLAYAGRMPMVGFHVQFDAAILQRDMRAQLGVKFSPPCLDLASLAPALFPELAGKLHTLDDWLAQFGIELHARHDALADAFGTAQLMLVMLEKSRQQGLLTANKMLRTAIAHQKLSWLNPR